VIVCHCQAVNDQQLRRTVREGADTPKKVASRCGAGRLCGDCRPLIDQILEEECPEPAIGPLELAASA
jgi:bacterioferritin-associated ferredoxin